MNSRIGSGFNYFINKNFRIKERPFPIGDIYMTAGHYESDERERDYSGTLYLVLRTPLGYSEVNQGIERIKWHKDCTWNHHDGFKWHFDMKLHGTSEIEHLYENIFNQLTELTSDPEIKRRIQFIQQKIYMMLKMYFMGYQQNFSSHDHEDFFINDYDGDKKPDYTATSMEARALYDAILEANVEKIRELLMSGINPDLYHQGWSPLNAAIAIALSLYTKYDPGRISRILEIIELLIDYGASPMLESHNSTSFEKILRHSQTEMNNYDEDYKKIMYRLTASNHFRPHINVPKEVVKFTKNPENRSGPDY